MNERTPEPAERALFTTWPTLRDRVPWSPLGDFPTPVERLSVPAVDTPVFVKRDDRSSPVYGGNKVRTLEALFGLAKRDGAKRIWSTGAYGSNHALAAVLHAPRAGLEPGVLLFPQPRSHAAAENLAATLSQRPKVRALPHWSFLPLGMELTRRADRREGCPSLLMVPGGATPEGALGYVSAGLELAQQVAEGVLPTPHAVVIGVGSTCTSAGLLVGLHAARVLGIGWREVPRLVAVRVTPWPVTSRTRILSLARRTAALLGRITEDPRLAFDAGTLGARFEVDGRQLGWGYGHPTTKGIEAMATMREAGGPELDTTYGGKSFAGVLQRARRGAAGPLLYWATKSTAPLPRIDGDAPRDAPRAMTHWLERAAT